MVDIRFKSKRIRDAKEERMRKIEIKRYLDSFTPETRETAHSMMSKIYFYNKRENKYGYISFLAIAIAIGAMSFGLWNEIYGKIIIIASYMVFALGLFFVIYMTYKADAIKKELGKLRIEGYARRETEK
ncbi:MAG: hypothetical protein ACXQTP_05200 [Candidatus Methanofastidiosia archaeon]